MSEVEGLAAERQHYRGHPMYQQWLKERPGIMETEVLSGDALALMQQDESVGFFGWLAALEARAAVNEIAHE